MRTRPPIRSLLGVAVVGALLLAACGDDDDSGDDAPADTTAEAGASTTEPAGTAAPATTAGGETTEAPSDGDALSVVLLIGGPSDDGGFYQAMVDGLQAGADADGAIDVTVREQLASGGDAALESAVREAAASGDFDLIVAHGFDLVPAVAKFAPEYPDQTFVTSLPVEGNPENVGVYLSVFEEIGYNAGFLAAQGTTANRIGFIGGPGLPFEKQAEAGFREAVETYAPGAEVAVVYTGSFEDPQLAQETATQFIESGIDSIWNQQAAGQSGVYTACAAAPEVRCFGNSSYSEAVAPDVVLASTVSNYGILVPLWAERLRTDSWTSAPDFLTQVNGGTIVTDATAAGAAALPDLQAAIDDFRSAIEAGEITVTPAPQD